MSNILFCDDDEQDGLIQQQQDEKRQKQIKFIQEQNQRHQEIKQEHKQKRKRRNNRDKKQDQQGESNQKLQNQPKTVLLQVQKCPAILIKDENEQEILLEDFIEREYQNEQSLQSDFSKEEFYGKTEYKYKLTSLDTKKLYKRTTQMLYRIREKDENEYSENEAIYLIGVMDQGESRGLQKSEMIESLVNLNNMAKEAKAELIIKKMMKGKDGKIAEVLIRKNIKQKIDRPDIRILLLGDQGAGKSTLISVLRNGENDDGKGKMRGKFLRHKHELNQNQIYGVNLHYLGFNILGNIVSQNFKGFSEDSVYDLIAQCPKVLTFIDIAGNKKAEKSLIQSLCSLYPEYSILLINPKQGITQVTENHMKYSQIFQIPLIILITHEDECDIEEFNNLEGLLKEKLNSLNPDYIPIFQRKESDIEKFAKWICSEKIIPIFSISTVTGFGIQDLQKFLFLLPLKDNNSEQQQEKLLEKKMKQDHKNLKIPTEFLIHGTIFNPIKKDNQTSSNIIFKGRVIQGVVKKGQHLHLGPFKNGKFYSVEVEEIQLIYTPVQTAIQDQICSVSVKLGDFAKSWLSKNSKDIRKGMVLVESAMQPEASKEFVIELQLFDQDQEVEIRPGYQPVITSQTIRQTCKIIIPRKSICDQSIQNKTFEKSSLTTSQSDQKKISISADTKQEQQRMELNFNSKGKVFGKNLYKKKRFKKQSVDILQNNNNKQKNYRKSKNSCQYMDDDHEFENDQIIYEEKDELDFKKNQKQLQFKLQTKKQNNINQQINENENYLQQQYILNQEDQNHYQQQNHQKTETYNSQDENTKKENQIKINNQDFKLHNNKGISNIHKKYFKQDQIQLNQGIPILKLIPKTNNLLRLRFLNPEYIKIGQKVIINDNLVKGIGQIKYIFY